MYDRKGFTLMELVVVMVIIGILAAISVPIYTTLVTEGAAKAAQNNLITIYNAQKNYYLNPVTGGGYYNSLSANDLAGINSTLSLNITDTNFKYTCTTAAGPSYSCKATSNADSLLYLTVTSGTPNSPNRIILPGGAGCTGPTTWGTPCNPSCTTNVAAFCPS